MTVRRLVDMTPNPDVVSFTRSSSAAGATGPAYVVCNSGSGRADQQTKQEHIATAFQRAGRAFELLLVEKSHTLPETAARAVALATKNDGVVVAAGGDGTINAVAHATLPSGRPFGVVPQGTFNYFSRNHGVPLDIDAAVQAIVDPRIKPVNVGQVNGHSFLVSASVGLYPKLIEEREVHFNQKFGRSRLVAIYSGIATVLREHRDLLLRLEHHNESQLMRTPTLQVNSNALQLREVGLPEAPAVEQGSLAAVIVKPTTKWQLLGLVLRGALGRLGDTDNVVSFAFKQLTVKPWLSYGRTRMKVAIDGEIHWLRAPLVFALAPQPLLLMLPNNAQVIAPSPS